eukprot:Seg1494.5 transcript_id=Seg1494.5/GoldUCD/mRNA.D3Y31 product="hypothetical protein" pseudo=true protein_id=Seg1494.5/GoldUCD/D3Y31
MQPRKSCGALKGPIRGPTRKRLNFTKNCGKDFNLQCSKLRDSCASTTIFGDFNWCLHKFKRKTWTNTC